NDWNYIQPEPLINLLEIWNSKTEDTQSLLGSNFKLRTAGTMISQVEEDTVMANSDTNQISKPILPRWLYLNIIDQLILPKLIISIESYPPLESPPLHTWVLPWLPILFDLPATITTNFYSTLRLKISSLIRLSSPTTTFNPASVVSPWLDVIFTKSELANLKTRTLIPKLITVLRNFKIDPQNQEIESLLFVLDCSTLLDPLDLVHLLETEFFPKWHRTLWTWLVQRDADYKEISAWFANWKSLFPPDVVDVEGDEGLARQFKHALVAMNVAITWRKEGGPVPEMPAILTPIADLRTAEAENAAKKRTQEQSMKDMRSNLAGSLSVKELLERVVAKAGLVLIPTAKVDSRTGRPVFRIAKASDKNVVVYVKESSGGDGEWVPKSVMEVVDMAGGNMTR
ncbi:hypothetical protein HK096_000269, partial [Nowakowskiella sp. JEL0078]